MVVRHRTMVGNPRYGRIGLVALPYFVIFELFGPIIEVLGLGALIASIWFGFASLQLVLLLMALSLSYGFVLSFVAILMEQRAFRRYPGWSCLGNLVLAAVVENLGYRQLMTVVRARAWWTIRRSAGWGEMTRTGFTEAVDPLPTTCGLPDGANLDGADEAVALLNHACLVTTVLTDRRAND